MKEGANGSGTRARPDLSYPWPRFWVPLEGTIDLSDAGFLRDPMEYRASARGPIQLAALQDWRALVLLGEPGIGKSATLKEEADRIAALPVDDNSTSIYVDLRAFSSETLLYRRIFESEKFIAWKTGTSRLFLHLDSLDEALLRIDSIANLLATVFPEVPTERMSIRIACRSAVWPADTLGIALKTIWGDGSGVFELAPLRRRDIITALEDKGIAIERFMRALFASQAVPFAIKPLTLKMLLTVFQQQGDLPRSNIELYRQGCISLCEEQNTSRRDTGRRGRLNAIQRMRLAGRIAAATILGNRFAVWTGPEVSCPKEDISVSSLAGHAEQGEFAGFDATDDDVREVLDTGLFSSRGEYRIGWAHQSYGEFLAALYLFERGVPEETLLKALLHLAGGLIPQLSIVAAWAASFSGGLRSALIDDEPWALLRGDLSGWSNEDRANLVRSLLESVETRRSSDSPYTNAEAYSKLKHPALADQLGAVISNKRASMLTRRLALIVAEKCALQDLQTRLLEVALDSSDFSDVRSMAVSALKYCGDSKAPTLVLPLAMEDTHLDPRDDIRGNALALLWPDHISATELFPLLTPSAEFYFGAYAMFKMTLPETLKTSDLLPALEWATQLIARTGPNGGFQDKTLADAIMFKAWEVFEEPSLIRPFLDHVSCRLHQFGELCRGTGLEAQDAFKRRLRDDVGRRHQFLLAVCAGVVSPIEAHSYRRAGLLLESDLEWLFEISPVGLHPITNLNIDTLLNFIDSAIGLDKAAHFEALYAAAEHWPALRLRYAQLLNGIRLESPEADHFRALQEQWISIDNNRPPPLVPDLSDQIFVRLAEAEAGRWQSWWQLTSLLNLTPDSRGWGNELHYFITSMPGWSDADETLQHRIVASAERYLADAETTIDAWLGHEPMSIQRNDVAGFRAFILLRQRSPERYGRIEVATWQKWAPVIVGLPRRTVIDNAPDIAHILTDALAHAPTEFVGAVQTIIRLERQRIRASGDRLNQGSPFFILRDLDGCWGNALLKDAIYGELCGADNTAGEYAALLDALLDAGIDEAFDHALGLLSRLEASVREQTLAIADVLLRHSAVRAWPAVRAVVASDDDLTREILLRVSRHFGFGTPFYAGMSEREIGNLYLLMARLFPRDADAKRATGFVGNLDMVGDLRDGAPRYLAGLGTEAAVVVLSELIADHAEFSFLAYELSLAERAMRIATWSPLTSKEVLALTDKPDLQLVTSPADLCQILVKALEKFGEALHAAQTPVRDLWDRQGSKDIFRPIDENALSDVIVRFLQAELGSAGIFANREVEVSRAPGAPVGQRTDILINAVRRRDNGDGYDSISAVIETKGCWNSELFTAIEEQLFRDYMIRLRAPVGIYLVGWFDAGKWDPEDNRRSRVPKITIEEVKGRLDAQAASLPAGFIVQPVILECHVPESPRAAARAKGVAPPS